MYSREHTVSEQVEVASRLSGAFPRGLAAEVAATLTVVPVSGIPPTNHDVGPVCVDGEPLHIPDRFYSKKPAWGLEKELWGTQRTILACLYSRHDDGFVRETYLRKLLLASEAWVPPFVLQLVGEYVIEIIQVVASSLDSIRNDSYRSFAAENPRYIEITKHRVISYWDCYHRRTCPNFREYPGFQVMDALQPWGDKDAKRLLVP